MVGALEPRKSKEVGCHLIWNLSPKDVSGGGRGRGLRRDNGIAGGGVRASANIVGMGMASVRLGCSLASRVAAPLHVVCRT